MGHFYDSIWADYFKEPVDDRPADEHFVRVRLRAIFEYGEWFEVYDFLEFALESPHHGHRDLLLPEVSRVLAVENAGFRLIGNQFAEITDEIEIQAIEGALEATGDRFEPARHHLETALRHLSRREKPDYRNSIKESISAVEAVTQILSGDPRAELGEAIKIMENGAPLHGALRSALLSLYGYTSDAEGIRHALTEAPNLDAADAKFMLVTCSAFVVYLIQKANPQIV